MFSRKPHLPRRATRIVWCAGVLAAALALAPNTIAAPTHHPRHRQVQQARRTPAPLAARLGFHSMLYLNTPFPFEQQMFADAAEAGVREMRMDLELTGVFPSPGVTNWVWVDQYTQLSEQYHVPILANLTATPGYEAGCGGENCPPAAASMWSYFVQVYAIAKHTAGVINDFEVWNEPDGSWSFQGTAQQYAQMESVAYAAIHAANPSARVVMGGLMNPTDPTWFDQAVAAGMRWDVTNIHMRLPLDQLAGWLRYWEQFGKPVWVTEMGYPADPAYQWESGYHNGAASQTAYDRQAIVAMLNAGAAKVFVTERDMPAGNGGFSSEGVIGRPAFQMVQQLAAGS